MLDAAYGRWLDIPLARVELIVALDFPRWMSKRRRMRAWEANPNEPMVVRFTRPRQVERWLRGLAPSGELREPVGDPAA